MQRSVAGGLRRRQSPDRRLRCRSRFRAAEGSVPKEVAALDAGLAHWPKSSPRPPAQISHSAGAGAAGGLQGLLLAFLHAELLASIDLVADVVGLTAALAEADLVLTGEGSFDSGSLRGKVHGVLRRAPQHCPVVVVAGTVKLSAAGTRAAGIAGAFSIAHGPAELQHLCDQTDILVRDTAAHIAGFAAHLWGGVRHHTDPQPRLTLVNSH